MAIAEVTVVDSTINVNVEGASLLTPLVAAAAASAAAADASEAAASGFADDAEASASLATETLSTAMALGYRAQYAYETNAAFASSPPASPVEGEKTAIFGEADPANNVWYLYNGTTWVEQFGVARSLASEWRIPNAGQAPYFSNWKTRWNSGTNNDGSYGGLRFDIDADGVTNYNPSNQFFSAYVDGHRRFEVNNFLGQTDIRIGSDDDTFVGIGHGGDGSLNLFSGVNAGSGNPEKLVTMGWANIPGEVVEVNFQGTSRVHLHSLGAFVMDAANARFELEGSGAGRIGLTGYTSASSDGRIIDFNNTGQTSYAGVLVSMSTVVNTQKLLQFNSLSGSTYTELGYVSGTGVLNLPSAVFTGAVQAYSATSIPAGGTTGSGIKVSSTSNFGVFFGSGAPTLSAAKGSLYLRSDGSGTSDRMYVNTNGSTTWTAVTTAA